MQNEKKWYAVYTKPKCERKVVDLLQKKKLKSYYPRYNEVEYWQERRKVVNVPLFTSLVFVYALEKDHSIIKQIDGVAGIMYWLHKPAVINNFEISSIRRFLEQHDNVKLEKTEVAQAQNISNEKSHQIRPYGIANFSNLHKVNLPSLGYALVSEAVVEEVKIVA
jgi:transcription antitermination factor NusG